MIPKLLFPITEKSDELCKIVSLLTPNGSFIPSNTTAPLMAVVLHSTNTCFFFSKVYEAHVGNSLALKYQRVYLKTVNVA